MPSFKNALKYTISLLCFYFFIAFVRSLVFPSQLPKRSYIPPSNNLTNLNLYPDTSCDFKTDKLPKAKGAKITFQIPCNWENNSDFVATEPYLIKQTSFMSKDSSFACFLTIHILKSKNNFTDSSINSILKRKESGFKKEGRHNLYSVPINQSYQHIEVDKAKGDETIINKKDSTADGAYTNSLMVRLYYSSYTILLNYYIASMDSAISSQQFLTQKHWFRQLYNKTRFN